MDEHFGSTADCRPSQRSWWFLFIALVGLLAGILVYRRDDIANLFAETPRGRGERVALEGIPKTPVADGFRPQVVVRPFEPITDVPVATAEEVSDPNFHFTIDDNELVLGVKVGDEARAYPINALTGPSREIINDTLGGVPIAATW